MVGLALDSCYAKPKNDVRCYIQLLGAAGTHNTDNLIGGFSRALQVVEFLNKTSGYSTNLYDTKKSKPDSSGFYLKERVVKLYTRENWTGLINTFKISFILSKNFLKIICC